MNTSRRKSSRATAEPEVRDPLATTDARACLEHAAALARHTGWPAVDAGHLALALFKTDDGTLDRLLRARLAGLSAETVADSLLQILELAAELGEAGAAAGEHDGCAMTADALALLEGCAALTADEQATECTLLTIASALFAAPTPCITEAFADAGVDAAALAELAVELAPTPGTDEACPPQHGAIFVDGVLELAPFGAPTQRALATLGRLARAPEGPRQLRDVDLLQVLLDDEGSRLSRALHVVGAPVAALRRHLRSLSPSPPPGPPTALREDDMNRLLRSVFEQAAVLASADDAAVIGESHLVRAHLARVAATERNLYDRHGIDSVRLRRYLETYFEEESVAETPDIGAEPPDIESVLRARVLHQDAAISRVVPALKRMRSGLGEPGRPLGLFLFLGPTGVGKTELARAMARAAFGLAAGERPSLIKIDCGKMAARHDASQLIGASQGYVGYGAGQLTNALGAHSQAVILFDEAEKAHRDVWQTLLALFDEGILQGVDGTEYDATGCIIVATSNHGYADAIAAHDPFATVGEEAREEAWARVETDVRRALESYFSPEFLGRFGRENVVFFRHFTAEDYADLVRLRIAGLVAELAAHGLEVEVDEVVIRVLADLAYARREEGARTVRGLITDHLRDVVVDAQLAAPERVRFAFTAFEGSARIVLEEA